MNLPSQFVQRVTSQLGAEVDALFDALHEPPPVSLRIHTGKFEGSLPLDSVPWANDGYYLNHRPVFTLDPLFHAGCYYVQEASSMFLEQAVRQVGATEQPLKVLDLCAAPGGKTTHLMSLLHRESLLVSNEVIRSRAWILVENVIKKSGTNTIVTNNDPIDFGVLGATFDLMVVDAPCSGEGLFRKNRDSINEWSPENLNLCSQRQRRILTDALPSLKVEGYLIYSTCTFNPEENEEVVRWLITEHGYELVDLEFDEAWGFTEVNIMGSAACQAFPHRVRGEGFFLAVLRKMQPSKAVPQVKLVEKKRRPKKRSRARCGSCEPEIAKPVQHSFEKVTRRKSKEFEPWLNMEGERLQFVARGDRAYAFTKSHVEQLLLLEERLKIITVGLPVGEWKKHGFVAAHGLVLSELFNEEVFPSQNLTVKDALRYLRREPIETSLPDGVGVVAYEGHRLGWVKQIGSRSNNWYPSEWRIRMPLPEVEPWSILREE